MFYRQDVSRCGLPVLRENLSLSYEEDKNMKNVLKSTWIGISIATIIFLIIGMIFDANYNGTFLMEHYSFTKMAAGCIFIGIGFGAPSVVYKNDAIPYPMQVLLHLGIGFAVLMIVSFTVGWIPTTIGVGGIVACILGDLAFVLIVWSFFYRYFKKEAAAINKRIEERAKK